MQLVESAIALHGASMYKFNLALGSEGLIKLDPLENGQTIRYNKKHGTLGVFAEIDGEDSLLAIGFIGHGCIIFDCLYFDSALKPFIKLIGQIK